MSTDRTDVFQFVALRPARRMAEGGRAGHFVVDRRDPADTVLALLLDTGKGSGSLIAKAKAVAEQREGGWAKRDGTQFEQLLRARDALADGPLAPARARAAVERAAGQSVERVAAAVEVDGLEGRLWDRLYIGVVLSIERPVDLDPLVTGLGTIAGLGRLAEAEGEKAETWLAKPLLPAVLVELLEELKGARRPREADGDGGGDADRERAHALVGELEANRSAIEALPLLRPQTRDEAVPPDAEEEPGSGRSTVRRSLLSAPSLEHLPRGAREQLEQHDVSAGLETAARSLEARQRELARELRQLPLTQVIDGVGADRLLALGLGALWFPWPLPTPVHPPVPSEPWRRMRVLGIGDLLVVKQKLLRYAAGEVAHIENVLKGETRRRRHRRLDRTETILVTTEEETQETERDLQSTERFELKEEAEKTVEEETSVKAGLTMSASYGPVSLGASGDFAYSTSTSDTKRTASNYAREVVDRSVSKIQKRTREEQTTKRLNEVEEVNLHGVDNADGEGHVTGIYRWVDKLYEAQVFNYGKRMMLEFVVPEPAAWYIWAQEARPAKQIGVEPPPQLPPGFSPDSITELNYGTLAGSYGATGIGPPPPPVKTVGVSFDEGEMANAHSIAKASKELVIPDGYMSWQIAWTGATSAEFHPDLALQIGDVVHRVFEDTSGGRNMKLNRSGSTVERMTGSVPVSLVGYDLNSYAVNVVAECVRSTETLRNWQIQTYEKIAAAALAARREYDDRARATEAAQAPVVGGRNPRANREIERNELKKLAITMMAGEYYTGFDAMNDEDFPMPEVDIEDAHSEGRRVQFFEQAFEWEQMTYLFYPYFWADRDNWVRNVAIQDADPLFTSFLQAGAARVVVPVHPAYNDMVLFFQKTGIVWSGGNLPGLEDSAYRSIAEELRDAQDDLADAKPYGRPWKVTLPTTLVHLQPDVFLPDFAL